MDPNYGWTEFLNGWFILIGAGILYLLPSLIASQRNHRQQVPIAVVNVCLGWTVIGWVVSLAWAYWQCDRS